MALITLLRLNGQSFASEAAMRISTEGRIQVHGGYGFVKEYHVERLMRDAKITYTGAESATYRDF